MDNLLHDSVNINFSKTLSFVFHTGCKVIAHLIKSFFLHRVNFLYTRIKHEKKTLIV